MGLHIGLKVSPLNRARRLWVTCAAQKSFISTMDMCFHLPQCLISTHKEAIFYTASFMWGENKFIVTVVTCGVSPPLWMRKLKLLRSVLGAWVPWTYFLAFIMKEVKQRKWNSWEKVILMLSLITIPTLAVAVTAVFFYFGGRGGNQWLQIYLFLSNAEHILSHEWGKTSHNTF